MNLFKTMSVAPTPAPRPRGDYKLLAALAGYGALRNDISP